MRRTLALLAVVAAGLVMTTGVANAVYGGASNAQCADSRDANGAVKTSFVPSEALRIVGVSPSPNTQRCANPGAQVTFTFSQSPAVVLGRMNADANGNYDTAALGMRVPADAKSGAATIRVETTLNNAAVSYTRAITITGAPARLPVTGRDMALIVMWGIVLVGFGSVLVTATWRRWQDSRMQSRLAAMAGDHADDAEQFGVRPAPTRAMPLARTAVMDRPRVREAAPRPSRGRLPPVDETPAPEADVRATGALVESPAWEQPVWADTPRTADRPASRRVEPAPVLQPEDEPADELIGDEVPAPSEEVEEVLRRTSEQTSEVVSKLQQQIRDWNRQDD